MLVLEENIKFVSSSENKDVSFPIIIYEPSEIYSQLPTSDPVLKTPD